MDLVPRLRESLKFPQEVPNSKNQPRDVKLDGLSITEFQEEIEKFFDKISVQEQTEYVSNLINRVHKQPNYEAYLKGIVPIMCDATLMQVFDDDPTKCPRTIALGCSQDQWKRIILPRIKGIPTWICGVRESVEEYDNVSPRVKDIGNQLSDKSQAFENLLKATHEWKDYDVWTAQSYLKTFVKGLTPSELTRQLVKAIVTSEVDAWQIAKLLNELDVEELDKMMDTETGDIQAVSSVLAAARGVSLDGVDCFTLIQKWLPKIFRDEDKNERLETLDKLLKVNMSATLAESNIELSASSKDIANSILNESYRTLYLSGKFIGKQLKVRCLQEVDSFWLSYFWNSANLIRTARPNDDKHFLYLLETIIHISSKENLLQLLSKEMALLSYDVQVLIMYALEDTKSEESLIMSLIPLLHDESIKELMKVWEEIPSALNLLIFNSSNEQFSRAILPQLSYLPCLKGHESHAWRFEQIIDELGKKLFFSHVLYVVGPDADEFGKRLWQYYLKQYSSLQLVSILREFFTQSSYIRPWQLQALPKIEYLDIHAALDAIRDEQVISQMLIVASVQMDPLELNKLLCSVLKSHSRQERVIERILDDIENLDNQNITQTMMRCLLLTWPVEVIVLRYRTPNLKMEPDYFRRVQQNLVILCREAGKEQWQAFQNYYNKCEQKEAIIYRLASAAAMTDKFPWAVEVCRYLLKSGMSETLMTVSKLTYIIDVDVGTKLVKEVSKKANMVG